jgi:hypothetical protein
MKTLNLDQKWDLITSDPLVPVFSMIDNNHPIRIYLGKSISNERLLLIVTLKEIADQRDMRSISLQKVKKENGEWSLILKLKDFALGEVFSNLCQDILTASSFAKTHEQGILLILRRLNSWRQLLEVGTTNLLDQQRIRGLFGELSFLKEYLIPKLGKQSAVNSWVGPLKSDQDFITSEISWEIKTTYSSAKNLIIASEGQLSSHPNIVLVVIGLDEEEEKAINKICLNEMVARIRFLLSDDMEASMCFDEKLLTAGYVERIEYNKPHFGIVFEMSYKVDGSFPRIKSSDLASGVSSVCYQIDRSVIGEFEIKVQS